jgi:hypothetical protein
MEDEVVTERNLAEEDAQKLSCFGLFKLRQFRDIWLKQRSSSQKDLAVRSFAAMGDTRIRSDEELNEMLDHLDKILREWKS